MLLPAQEINCSSSITPFQRASMERCPVCNDTGQLLDAPCPLCDDVESHGEDAADTADTSNSLISENDIQQLRAASTADDRERLFRSLALQCHPDKFPEGSCKAEATRMFQKLLEIREEARIKLVEEALVCSVDANGCPPLRVLRQRDVVHGIAVQADGTTTAF